MIMCPKCIERSMFLFASGLKDKDVIKEVLKEMGGEDRKYRCMI